MSDGCDFRELMARCRVRATALRMAVLETLGEAPRAMNALEIMDKIKGRRRVNRVTVYRILEDFTRRGLLRKLSVEGRSARYELACAHHPPHPHFQCHRCGEVQCLDPLPMGRVWTQLRGPMGSLADQIEIRVAGLCSKCRSIEAGL